LTPARDPSGHRVKPAALGGDDAEPERRHELRPLPQVGLADLAAGGRKDGTHENGGHRDRDGERDERGGAALSGPRAARGSAPDVLFKPGLHWAPLAMVAIEGPLAVGTSVWLLALAQRRLNRPPGSLGRALARSAYGAFFLQGVVLIGLMIALRPIAVPAEVKALVVAGLGVSGSFALAWLLVSRTRLGRII
jgi:hypothetical protein